MLATLGLAVLVKLLFAAAGSGWAPIYASTPTRMDAFARRARRLRRGERARPPRERQASYPRGRRRRPAGPRLRRRLQGPADRLPPHAPDRDPGRRPPVRPRRLPPRLL